jgi:hypothetical protein
MELPAWDDLQYTQRFWFMLGVDCALGLQATAETPSSRPPRTRGMLR